MANKMQLLALALAFEEEEGAFRNLVQELHLDDTTFFRLDKSQLEDLLRRIGPAIFQDADGTHGDHQPRRAFCICLRWVTLTKMKEIERVSVCVCVLEIETPWPYSSYLV